MNQEIEVLFREEQLPGDPREVLERLTNALLDLPESFEPALSHYKAKGLYGRRIYVPAGVVVATRVHKYEHFTVALTGECVVRNERGDLGVVRAPSVFITQPGTQRACYALTDTQWFTVHAVDSVDDVTKMNEVLACRTFAEYEQLFLEHQS